VSYIRKFTSGKDEEAPEITPDTSSTVLRV
jgi:hypothetical protein